MMRLLNLVQTTAAVFEVGALSRVSWSYPIRLPPLSRLHESLPLEFDKLVRRQVDQSAKRFIADLFIAQRSDYEPALVQAFRISFSKGLGISLHNGKALSER